MRAMAKQPNEIDLSGKEPPDAPATPKRGPGRPRGSTTRGRPSSQKEETAKAAFEDGAKQLAGAIGDRRADDGRPSRVVALGTKPRDRSLSALRSAGWPVIKKWPPSYGQEHVIVWPKYGDPDTAKERQARVFRALLRQIFSE